MLNIGLFPINCLTPTHFTQTSSTLLDIFFVSVKAKVLLYDQLSVPNFSKHDLIFLSYDFHFVHDKYSYSYRDFTRINYEQLSVAVDTVNWGHVRDMVSSESQIDFLQTHIKSLFDRFVPLVTKKNVTQTRPGSTHTYET